MVAIPPIPTFTVGEKLTAAKLNQFGAWMSYNKDLPTCKVSTASVAYSSGSFQLVTFTAAAKDNDSMWDNANPSRVRIQTSGWYEVKAWADWGSNSTGVRSINVRSNAAGSNSGGASVKAFHAAAANGNITSSEFSWDAAFSAGDYLEMFVQQTSGGSINATSWFTVRKVGEL